MAHATDMVDLAQQPIESSEDSASGHPKPGRVVLTLLGGERQAKQLFSSLGKRKSPDDFNELALPNGIFTTTVVPTHSANEDEDQKTTLRDLVHRHNSIPNLPTPRPSKLTVTRNSSVPWHTPSFTSSKSSTDRKGTYSTQSLATGNWLDYNVAPGSGQDTTDTKRKQRDRRLSYDEAPSPTRAEVVAAQNQAKDDALFQSVFSGTFAPDRDDTLAVIPTQQKSRLWWLKYGREKYQELLDVRNENLNDLNDGDIQNSDELDVLDQKTLQEIVENWEPPSVGLQKITGQESYASPDLPDNAQDSLDKISELIEGISTFQRARHESFSANARNPVYNSSNSSNIGTSTDPSPAEVELYEAAKVKLAKLVSELPPYTLAKLEGDQLGALQVSTKIMLEGKNHKGMMDEDELSAKSRAIARSTVPPAATQTPNNYAGAHARGGYASQTQTPAQHFSRTAYTATPNQYRRTAETTNGTTNHYTPRPSSGQYQPAAARSTYSAHQSYASHRPPSYADRFANGTYNTPHAYGSYANGYRLAPGQVQASYSQYYSTPQSRVQPPAAAAMPAYRATPSDYQQRAPAVASHASYNYGHAPTVTGPAGSPQPQHRASYAPPNPTAAAAAPRLSYYQQTAPISASQSPAPPTNGVSAATNGVGRSISPADPAALINYQKAHLADSQPRPGPGTPQPAVENGVQQNGVSTSSSQ